MAARWSSENVVAEYRDMQANAMAVDMTAKYAVLAGRRCLGIVQLDNPIESLKKFPRQSKWEVGTAEWNPNFDKRQMFALTCNQRAELVVWRDGELSSQHVLRAHTRVISDLNWSPFDSNMIATCSVDTFIYVWDIRDSRKPAIALSAVAASSQVKWNKMVANVLATSHEGDIRLWDYRKVACPIQYVAAHLSKIHGLDWSPIQEYQLATSSQDCTVKFWDVSNPCRPLNTLASGSPVWRARYTPFGDGLVTVVVPQLRRGENGLLLWNMSNLMSPVHTFMGHTDVVLEFEWRKQRDGRDFQLVTWSKDQSLRIWRIDLQLQKLCGDCDDPLEAGDRESLTSSTSDSQDHLGGDSLPLPRDEANAQMDITKLPAVLRSHEPSPSLDSREESHSGNHTEAEASVAESGDSRAEVFLMQPKNLQQEFSLLNKNISNVRIEEMDPNSRTCTVCAAYGKHKVRLMLTFPSSYPFNASPAIQFCSGTTVDSAVKNKLSKVLKTTCQQHVKKNLSCLEPCLRQLTSTLEACVIDAEKAANESNSKFGMEKGNHPAFLPLTNVFSPYQDNTIPFPRTCGATFSAAGFLVTFTRPVHMKCLPSVSEVTPRSLSALAAYVSNTIQPIGHSTKSTPPFNLKFLPLAQSPTGESSFSISSFYYQDRRQPGRNKFRKNDIHRSRRKIGSVVIYDVNAVLPISKELAQSYQLDAKDLAAMCNHNASVAASVGRKDLVQVWTLASISASPLLNPPTDVDRTAPWACHPLGRQLLQSLISHYLQIGDIQTVAMLCCAFTHSAESPQVPRKCRSIPDTVIHTHITGKWWLKPGGSPYHTIHPGDTSLESWSIGTLLKTNRSNSWSDSLDDHDYKYPAIMLHDSRDLELERHKHNIKLLDPKVTHQYDGFKWAYAEVLYQWGLLQARAQVLKYISTPPEPHKGIEFLVECQHCHRDVRGPQCLNCKNYSFRCTICHIAVKGSSSFCVACGHGGHTSHLMAWFSVENVCPAGCGCNCVLANQLLDA